MSTEQRASRPNDDARLCAQTTTRRAALAGALAAIPAAAGAVPALPAEPDTSAELARLIEQHREAFAAFGKAIDRFETIKGAYEATHGGTELVPTSLGVSFELRVGQEEIRRRVTIEYDEQRRRLAGLARVAPDLADQARAALTAGEAEDLAGVDRAFAEEDIRQEAFGLTAADQAYNAASDAEDAALLALCGHRCVNMAEARAKAEYLAEYKGELLDEHVAALIGSFRAVADTREGVS